MFDETLDASRRGFGAGYVQRGLHRQKQPLGTNGAGRSPVENPLCPAMTMDPRFFAAKVTRA